MNQKLQTSEATRSIHADRHALTVTGTPIPVDAMLSILFDGRPVWNVRSGDATRPGPEGGSTIDWPPALAGRLTGWALLTVLQDGQPIGATKRVVFDAAPHHFALVEPGTGIPQIVNKWGRIARNFEGRRAHLVDEALDEACALIDWMHGQGLEPFVTGGTLLGPVRDGRIMPGDDDVDLAYLSRFENPSDIALESFALERALHRQGYQTVRHSAGHLQVLFPGEDGTDRFYLDIFAYFITAGWFHGTFHAREPQQRVPIFPLTTLTVNNRTLPAPNNPEAMLEAIYGPGWRSPDPAFRFVTPPPARRRYETWLGNLDGDRENWEDHHRGLLTDGNDGGAGPWAEHLARRLPPGSRILELGCGLGRDARHFAEQGHHVVAVDYSRPALESLSAFRTRSGGSLQTARVNMNNLREVVPLAKLANEGDTPVFVYGRLLLDSLSEQGSENTLRLLRHLLGDQPARAGAFLEFQAEPSDPPFPGSRFHHPVDTTALQRGLGALGLETRVDDRSAATCRMEVRALP
ncbi:LicD family protein [Arthrobacter sp. ISL-85]|uniref:class I SAM-dependent methyltransferase n=1 Tax=Arthrobacter sp. ISL-85 TaxID=2819115 RepID=UPI001BE6F376|nr:class I SAM-dependent methyltransferase [Arthrobacter sp. ISL-85]MBT2566301.1 LicD family protein [Arthrobacter sp. ISL-85]